MIGHLRVRSVYVATFNAVMAKSHTAKAECQLEINPHHSLATPVHNSLGFAETILLATLCVLILSLAALAQTLGKRTPKVC